MRVDKKEIHAVVLDVLSKGYVDDPRPVYKREALVQAIGEEQFKLLELIPKTLEISLHERIYIGDLNRDKIERVKRRISYTDLTQTARVELVFAIEKMVMEREPEFVKFFNKAISITPKLHMLHLLPGIGKKLLWEILDEREKRPFDSFHDLSSRIKSIPHPEKMIINRILEELKDPNIKYHAFTSR